jgi:protein transport protein SEC31
MGIIKEVKRTANVAWSPRSMQSIYLAAGTVAQQLDATFSTTASLEVFALHLNETELDMPRVGHVETKQRFHKLIWSGHGGDDMGVVLGGSDNGIITIWNMDKLIKSEEPLVATLQEHVGAVRSLDVNPFQPNLIASGASESEVYIWDLNNTTTPMSPGSKPHPLEDISGLAWNRQVQHILASTSPGGRSIVWDLRKNEPIIQVSDSNSRVIN